MESLLLLLSLEIRSQIPICVKGSTVESVAIVEVVTVLVKQGLLMSKIFAKTYVQGSTVDRAGTV